MNFLKQNKQRVQQKNLEEIARFSFNDHEHLNKKKTEKIQQNSKNVQKLKKQEKQVSPKLFEERQRQNFHFEYNKNQNSNIQNLSKLSQITKKSLSPKKPKESTIKIHKHQNSRQNKTHFFQNTDQQEKQFQRKQPSYKTEKLSNKIESAYVSKNQKISYNQWAFKTLKNKTDRSKSKSKLQNFDKQNILNKEDHIIKKTESVDNLQQYKPQIKNQAQILKNLRQIAQLSAQKEKQDKQIIKNSVINNNKNKQKYLERNQEKSQTMSIAKSKTLTLSQKRQKKKKKFQQKMKHIIRLCHFGQYINKRFQTSDGGDQRFLRLTEQNNYLEYSTDQSKLLSGGSRKQFLIEDILGVVYGKVTDVFLKDCNKKLQLHKCFSIIFKKHTLNIYCSQEKDILFWLPGISYQLQHNRKDLFNHKKYSTQINEKIKKSKIQEYNDKSQESNKRRNFYSLGRTLWKRTFLLMQNKYIGHKLIKQHKYKNANAYAIRKFGQDKFGLIFKKE